MGVYSIAAVKLHQSNFPLIVINIRDKQVLHMEGKSHNKSQVEWISS